MSSESVQPKLFEQAATTVDPQKVLLYALGEFQSRGHKLAGREMALDRLHGAISRSRRKFGIDELPNETIAQSLRKLGADVTELPEYIAKRPYRVLVPAELAQAAKQAFDSFNVST